MMYPRVSFIVPCYNLAHVLAECVNSILSQTYGNFEVLIMDDCSPDNTSEVAQSFNDSRVKHERNDKNLGHLANYNKGIVLARGEYVWLISADDRLRKPDVLEKYVVLMDEHPEVGYVFCPAISLENGSETGLMTYSFHGDQDIIFNGNLFLNKLLEFNSVPAASALVRKECYVKVSLFPLDMPYAGDWYLWCIFALHYDVAYFAEPMVNYRQHAYSMTKILTKENIDILFYDDMSVRRRIRDLALIENKNPNVVKCNLLLIDGYMKRLATYDLDNIEESIYEYKEILNYCRSGKYEWQKSAIRVYSDLADRYYEAGKFNKAKMYYKDALYLDWTLWKVWPKFILLHLGKFGISVRAYISDAKYKFSHL